MDRSSSGSDQQLKLVEVVSDDADVAGQDALLTLDADDAEEPGATATGSASTLRSSSME
nr:hypothetical protein [Spiractinospora alimapuensis]